AVHAFVRAGQEAAPARAEAGRLPVPHDVRLHHRALGGAGRDRPAHLGAEGDLARDRLVAAAASPSAGDRAGRTGARRIGGRSVVGWRSWPGTGSSARPASWRPARTACTSSVT